MPEGEAAGIPWRSTRSAVRGATRALVRDDQVQPCNLGPLTSRPLSWCSMQPVETGSQGNVNSINLTAFLAPNRLNSITWGQPTSNEVMNRVRTALAETLPAHGIGKPAAKKVSPLASPSHAMLPWVWSHFSKCPKQRTDFGSVRINDSRRSSLDAGLQAATGPVRAEHRPSRQIGCPSCFAAQSTDVPGGPNPNHPPYRLNPTAPSIRPATPNSSRCVLVPKRRAIGDFILAGALGFQRGSQRPAAIRCGEAGGLISWLSWYRGLHGVGIPCLLIARFAALARP
ncbi:hypothetical protein CONLIGDRAFT_701588 [Coniochaeta ligniaria NRRL 30616]|uniref:Uncharacterized protein n=1 Tax=Coniochaeta ligniaria NRRL 30616 TaxID=1408157 RepID=A0A1J7JJP2_9PEZI|nr:hypothetical protein CONLIGDRAFT_701588 [Coniochaeta ligniaria NRRL 30616]